VRVAGLGDVTAIAARGNHSLALRRDGTTWAFGANDAGQLGDGTTTVRTRPVLVPGLAGVAVLEGGAEHSFALLADGTFRTWGDNGFGQLGDGSMAASSVPVQPSLTHFLAPCDALPTCVSGACIVTVCSGKGVCTNGACECAAGFSGASCGLCAPDHYDFPVCAPCEAATTCGGQGTCRLAGGCVCDVGFAGPACEYSDATTCSGHGTATDSGGCTCRVGYAPPRCDACVPGFAGYPSCALSGDGGTSGEPPATGCGCSGGGQRLLGLGLAAVALQRRRRPPG
jgi:hypothetical protein